MIQQSKHTPGPWKYAAANQTTMESVQYEPPRVWGEDGLLAALENARIALTFYREWMHAHTVKTPDDEPGTNYPFGDSSEKEARAAIAKARGEA